MGQVVNSETLLFKTFKVTIFDFVSEKSDDSVSNSTSTNLCLDTIMISENPCDANGWYIDGKKLKISSKSQLDSFTISYAYQIDFSEIDTSQILSNREREKWTYVTSYYKIPRIDNNIFLIPKNEYLKYLHKSIKKDNNLRDTSLLLYAMTESPMNINFIKKRKLIYDNWSYAYLRIRRFNDRKLKETKYIRIGLSNGCD